MANARPTVPAPLERELLVEAGHRCAIPNCRQTPTELAHIEPWAKVREHKFDNMIALCPTCHTRYDRGEIDRKAMLQYKMNLGVINSRYSDVERRIIQIFSDNPNTNAVKISPSLRFMLYYLLRDGIINRMQQNSGISVGVGGLGTQINDDVYVLTEKGRNFVARWTAGRQLD